jgi:hypothetical protein
LVGIHSSFRCLSSCAHSASFLLGPLPVALLVDRIIDQTTRRSMRVPQITTRRQSPRTDSAHCSWSPLNLRVTKGCAQAGNSCTPVWMPIILLVGSSHIGKYQDMKSRHVDCGNGPWSYEYGKIISRIPHDEVGRSRSAST